MATSAERATSSLVYTLFIIFLSCLLLFPMKVMAIPQDYFYTVQKLYIAYYQRPADPEGLIFWAQKLDEVGGDLKEIINAFANSPEAQMLYGGKTIEQILTEIYQAAFNRNPDPEGLKFYSEKIKSGEYSLADVMLRVLDGASGDDKILLLKKIEIAQMFTQAIDPELDGKAPKFAYEGTEDARLAREWLRNSIVSPDTPLPSFEEVENIVKKLIGRNDSVGEGDNFESQELSVGNFRVTMSLYSSGEDLNTVCEREFGEGWKLADWNKLKEFYKNGGSLEELLNHLGLHKNDEAWVSVDGNEFWSPDRHYFIARHNHDTSFICGYGAWPSGGCFLAHDNLDNYLVSLGSWHGKRKVLCFNDNPEVLSGDILFLQENFNTLDNWYLVIYNSAGGSEKDLAPVLDFAMGSPSPSLDVNGDSWCGNGIYSKQTFDYTRGLTIEWDMYVDDKRFEGCWVTGSFGLADHQANLQNPREDGAYVDSSKCDPSFLAGVVLDAVGPLCWMQPENQGHARLMMYIRTQSGNSEKFEVIGDWADELLGGWHHYKIRIKENGRVEFYVDRKLIWVSKQKIDMAKGKLPVLAGTRDAYGPVRIDNVKVYKENDKISTQLENSQKSVVGTYKGSYVTISNPTGYCDPEGKIKLNIDESGNISGQAVTVEGYYYTLSGKFDFSTRKVSIYIEGSDGRGMLRGNLEKDSTITGNWEFKAYDGSQCKGIFNITKE